MSYVLQVQLVVKPENVESFMSKLMVNAKAARGEPGCKAFDVLVDPSDKTKVMLQLEFDPEGIVEKAGAGLGVVERRAEGDLERFRDYIQARGRESGAWRGTVEAGQPKPPTAS